jgi:hypothetical protein
MPARVKNSFGYHAQETQSYRKPLMMHDSISSIADHWFCVANGASALPEKDDHFTASALQRILGPQSLDDGRTR